jgi:hypothetical protein
MRKVEEIEAQIKALPRKEFAELRDWLLDQDWTAWDAQIEEDSKSGKLDTLIAEAQAEYKSGKARPL